MNKASICTIGDEILIGQIVDTNSSEISRALNAVGIQVERMVSIGDRHDEIIGQLSGELRRSDIVIVTGGLGPTKDDITKDALAELSGSSGFVENREQKDIVVRILHSRGLDVLDANLRQAMVPDTCEVIPNRYGTAPVMAFHFKGDRFGHDCVLYSLPGVPYEAVGMLPDVINDIKRHFSVSDIYHKTIMTYGVAESALAKRIEAWEDALPENMHLAYLPNQLTGVRLRLSIYGGERQSQEEQISERIAALKEILGDVIYADSDTTIESTIGSMLRGSGRTLCVAESCTGGMISHLLTTVPGASEYYLGSVTSYSAEIKNKFLGVKRETIEECGIVSSKVAAEMAEGARAAMSSTYSVSTTGWADSYGDDHEPAGTVWVGVSGPSGTRTFRFNYKNDRKRNIERFAASALNALMRYIKSDMSLEQ